MHKAIGISAFTLVAFILSANSGKAGRVGGPGAEFGTAPGLQSVYFDVAFTGGEPAVINLVGDGRTNMDLRVHDSQGRMIPSRGDRDRRQAAFQVDRGGFFRIEVLNLGRSPNSFMISTN